ncbi:MAG: DinB family protein [Candidatus Korobacteraceae bacterium]|jgi:uncharacterized damage-inducible protein DinB
MKNYNPGRPDESEYPPYSAKYVNLVPGSDILPVFAAQLEETTALLKPLDDRAAAFAYAPGKWTLKQVVGHVVDTERIFAYRALCVARGESGSLPGFEQDDYVAAGSFGERTLSSLLDEFRVARQATIAFFQNLPQQAWMRRGNANKFSVTVRGIAFLAAGHELHHVKILREKYLAGLKG